MRLWLRSTEHNLKYKTFAGNGDSSAFKAMCQLNGGRAPYDVAVIKEEFINHDSKRIGVRLRKKRLTDDSTDHLSKYFGTAVHENIGFTSETMKKATYFHLSSTDEYQGHHFCPPGVISWCFYNRAKALDKNPTSHSFKISFFAKISRSQLQRLREMSEELTSGGMLTS